MNTSFYISHCISISVFVDLTSPIEGSVVDGIQNDFMDLKYTASKSTAGLQWKGYTDPESGIGKYSVKVLGLRSAKPLSKYEHL